MKIIECPRDAMQGIQEFIPTDMKVDYLNQLLKVNFDTLDFGSFVSPKAIPQLKDTAEVLNRLDLNQTKTKLLAILANERGAEDACKFEEIQYLGFPLSVSETFQQRNTNKSIQEAFETVQNIQNLCTVFGKQQVVYLSMGFGNPYGDPYSPEMMVEFVESLKTMGISIISMADTIGVSNPTIIKPLFEELIRLHPDIEFGAHLHSTPHTAREKVVAAYEAGCRRFDGALRGFGGCPMAKDELVGNLATEQLLEVAKELKEDSGINEMELAKSLLMSNTVFSHA
ncbi:hydroxymethylglutaryl-CoA lyase [Cytophagales bacterium LB-30]|uniref:Hydroxymethylglutaryl-CoA lyase n=1 Tax=Shiella aurantiaca TaxID=3058365 RepID=A0ABT8F485_9BACT|nr:hydroxymethylglutaryl-CoA lyase [Shiella aurantiaca]MDN4165203.1 hydroxymethylglutaryl-CoA lyase [Shiella aurantiaca]